MRANEMLIYLQQKMGEWGWTLQWKDYVAFRPDQTPGGQVKTHRRGLCQAAWALICPLTHCSFILKAGRFSGKWEFGKARAAPSLAAGSRQAERDWPLPGGATF